MAFQLKKNQNAKSNSSDVEYSSMLHSEYDPTVHIPSREMRFLKGLSVGVLDPPTIRQSECLMFTEGGVHTFSGDLGAFCNKDYGIRGAVNYKNFLDVYERFGDKPVTLETKENTLFLKCGRTEVCVPIDTILSCDFSGFEKPDKDEWVTLSPDYVRALRDCANLVRTTNRDDVLSSISVEQEKVCGGSSAELMCRYINSPFDRRFLIRANPLLKILKKDVKKAQLIGKWLYFQDKLGGVVYNLPVYDDEYIDVEEYFQPVSNVIVFPRKELLEALDTCMGVVKGEEKIRVQIDSITKVCRIRGKSIGTKDNSCVSLFKTEVPMDSSISADFLIEPKVLYRVVYNYPECTLCFGNGIRVNTPELSYSASIE